jgi:hypothetical protein
MLSHCANAQCSKPFLRLREGKLFLVETDRVVKPGETTSFVRGRQQSKQVERYWLCEDCASRWTLIYDKELGVVLAQLRRPELGAENGASAVRRGAA